MREPSQPILIDSHAHLDSGDYAADLSTVIERATEFGVAGIVTIGIEPADWDATIRIALNHPGVFPALGIHPNSANQTNDATLERLAALCAATHPRVVGIGETGLDYYREFVSPEVQRASFRRHLALARELDLPVIIHNRDAHADVLDILEKSGKGTRGVMHSFSGDMDYAKRCIDLGYLISISGPVTFRKAHDKHEIAMQIPLESLMVETDCPFLTPEPYRGRRNEPAYVRYTAEAIARLRSVEYSVVAEATTANAIRLFGMSLPGGPVGSTDGTAAGT